MISLVWILLLIIILFVFFISLRSFSFFKICALCAASASSWIILLGYYYLGNNVDPLLIAILMGGSIVGLMYLLEEKLPQELMIFKLPYFLTALAITYFILGKSFDLKVVSILGSIWLIGIIIYFGRNSQFKEIGKKIIECCKNW